ncbi:hypothetical protein AAFF_G00303130 [Aldrovandia affinis]|uniref:VLIG-type G domain-containing protein n=1 Tax=Aldrovandia affinis TaxID=143900 RepID=A0AAD7W1F7_9TELE|nr:hypothetical protein AAFF_G00303130 [Aldrovandia affinis]
MSEGAKREGIQGGSEMKETESTEAEAGDEEQLTDLHGVIYKAAGVISSLSKCKGSLQKEYSDSLLRKVQLSISKFGGPAETDDHLKWKSGLLTSNSRCLKRMMQSVMDQAHGVEDFPNRSKILKWAKLTEEELPKVPSVTQFSDLERKLNEVKDGFNNPAREIEFPVWALRQIKKTLRKKQQHIFNVPMPIVSFVRLGISSTNSKSQILSNIISKRKHPVFFNRHSNGSMRHCLLMDGVVEIVWYCGGSNDRDVFDDCVAFVNLHGDASNHPAQLRFLQEVSSVTVLLHSENALEKRAKESSGKSTLLNTMFGLQFAVSAGRCTRGAIMQLLEVDEEMRANLQFDFVLVVDTEGLRSTELSSEATLCHNNELATFIIGVGNMTLINIMGENPCEMQDILQICVQAFMRMTSVRINTSCIFVHQNVSETTASEKNQEGRRHLQNRLDQMTAIAANEENLDIKRFSDIIQFDVDTQVFYFKNLLEGDPPMAPPNPSYSQNVQELKNKLLSITQWQPGCNLPTLSEVKERIKDLWDALLGENFVFNFRNTLEIAVYSKLEKFYGQWSWSIRKHALVIQQSWHNKINSNLKDAVHSSDLMKEFDETYKTLTGISEDVCVRWDSTAQTNHISTPALFFGTKQTVWN